jgi:hypothetical protein
VFGPKLEVRVELIDRLPKGLLVSDDLADRRLVIGLQQAVENCGHNGHRLQRDMMAIDPLQIGPRPTTILRRAGTFPARTERVAASWVHRQRRFEPEVTDPVIDEVIDVAETLPPMEAQRCKRHVARITIDVRAIQPWSAIRFAMDVKRVKIGVAPREDDLQRLMEGGQGCSAADEKPAPDQGADPLDDYTELIDVG